MRNDLERDSSFGSSLDPFTTKHEVTSIGKEYLSQVTEPAKESHGPYSSNELHSLGEAIQGPGGRELRGTRRRQRLSPTTWRLTLMIGDGVLLLTSLALLLLLAPHFHLGLHVSWSEPATWDLKLMWGCIALLSWSVAVNIVQAQDLLYASSAFKSPFRALFALVLGLIFWIVLTYPFIVDRIASSAMVLLLFLVIASPILSIWRVTFAAFMNSPRFRHQGVIIGVNTAGKTIAKELRNSKRPSANILGYISESTDEDIQKDGLPVLGDKSTLRCLTQNGIIDVIIMAIDYKANPALFQEALEAAQLGISVVPMTMVYERTSGKIPVEHAADQWYVALPSERIISPLYLCWRKVMDVTFGVFGMALLCLVSPILALLISLESPGPIFYSQERLGYQGRKFRMLKFRSMRPDAEHQGHAMWAAKYDSRVTQVGRALRALHLDELPQVLNILCGEMSLIGPRPEREEFVTELEKIIPFYCCRLSVKPGLTGWAQVQYPYGSTSEDALIKLQYDLYYIKHQSFTLDIFIVLKTVIEVFLCRGR